MMNSQGVRNGPLDLNLQHCGDYIARMMPMAND